MVKGFLLYKHRHAETSQKFLLKKAFFKAQQPYELITSWVDLGSIAARDSGI